MRIRVIQSRSPVTYRWKAGVRLTSSHFAPFARYRGVLLKFSLSTRGDAVASVGGKRRIVGLQLHLTHPFGVNPEFKITKFGVSEPKKT